MFYTEEHAAMLIHRSGEKWRPSNGHEFDLFGLAYCAGCTKRDNCTILPATMAHDVDEDEYPEDWQIGEDGQPVCTAQDH